MRGALVALVALWLVPASAAGLTPSLRLRGGVTATDIRLNGHNQAGRPLDIYHHKNNNGETGLSVMSTTFPGLCVGMLIGLLLGLSVTGHAFSPHMLNNVVIATLGNVLGAAGLLGGWRLSERAAMKQASCESQEAPCDEPIFQLDSPAPPNKLPTYARPWEECVREMRGGGSNFHQLSETESQPLPNYSRPWETV